MAMDQAATKDSLLSLAIVGGGVAGVCLALGILKHAPQIRLHIYEAAPRFQEIGAGVAFGINAQRALYNLDPRAGDAYHRIASSNGNLDHHSTVIDSSGRRRKQTYVRLVMGMDHRTNADYQAGAQVCEVFSPCGFSSVHRARYLESMVALLPDEVRQHCVSFDHRLVSVEDDARSDGTGIDLVFANGKRASFDAVIGCDGIRSNLRKIVLADEPTLSEPIFSGKYAYRGLIPMDQAAPALGDRLARNAVHHVGYSGHVLTFPIDHGKTVNAVAFRAKLDGRWEDDQWVQQTSKDEMLRDFESWGANVKGILSMMQTCDKWALFEHPAASTYRRAGPGLAIEDAVVLSRLLGNVRRRGDVVHAFEQFESLRKDRTQRLVRCSREQGEIFDFECEGIRDDVRKIAEVLPRRWDWIWDLIKISQGSNDFVLARHVPHNRQDKIGCVLCAWKRSCPRSTTVSP
ncbi:FAD/NAD(P)-binding domain-containing protein [Teratosphaeria nubilosa]|uniref:FAD/NAD(P)-binding domain-containing protein n=1 Tax=Teratosphaeria nubilosa TaxID=161662 RepID=A0A6G1LJ05_9PEZI|nr:FAD/NAD(P)-binding domain-containing protein [Teratosphaeria nubilosa]